MSKKRTQQKSGSSKTPVKTNQKKIKPNKKAEMKKTPKPEINHTVRLNPEPVTTNVLSHANFQYPKYVSLPY